MSFQPFFGSFSLASLSRWTLKNMRRRSVGLFPLDARQRAGASHRRGEPRRGVYGTLTSVIVASAVTYLPHGMRYPYAGVLQIHSDVEEASTAYGAPQMQTFIKIVLPLLSASMISCRLFVFLALRAMRRRTASAAQGKVLLGAVAEYTIGVEGDQSLIARTHPIDRPQPWRPRSRVIARNKVIAVCD
ncbi:ABC transporter permease subunit [Ensifer sp. IC4062]|nr:ABC transporter permease subunit [Ensifer sp. IC4062]